ncbi:MAG TPA: hypothetical protein DHU55_05310 [Blastocatellia bacterium]|nr:hypothetical protein [Blastocatellia bacterium]HCX29178.1 hypothetical protein [Blastocatellia bacterium]
MSKELVSAMFFCGLIMVTGLWLSGCAKPSAESSAKTSVTQSQFSPAPTNLVSPTPAYKLGLPTTSPTPAEKSKQPPKPEEVNNAVARVFEKVATPDTARNPNFILGDFNGDGSEDIAVVLKPNETMFVEINSEVANWILEDPRSIPAAQQQAAVKKIPPRPAPVRAQKGDSLLAIIHGVGSQGWRNPEAKQSFLLKNGAGANMSSRSAKDLRTGKDRQKMPTVRGDAISETVGGQSGLVYWTGAKYGWYSPGPQ